MEYYREKVVAQMEKWIGCRQGDATHKEIIDIYNSKTKGYRMTYQAAWCAATVSAVAIALGYEAIIPIDVSCNNMITKAQEMGIWEENDAYNPKPGDIIMYSWSDDGKGDCIKKANHVGIVKSSIGGSIYVMEGNMGDSHVCGSRRIAVNGKCIRGFILPRYTDKPLSKEEISTEVTYTVSKGDNLSRIASKMRDNGYEVTWREIAALNGISSPYTIYPGQKLVIRK